MPIVDDWRMDCPWWLDLTVIPYSGLWKPFVLLSHESIRYIQEGLEPNGCRRAIL